MGEPKTRFASLIVQGRDLAILRGFFESRIMTAAHVAALYFAGKKEASKKRLQKLKAAGFINERKRRVNESAVLYLTRKGYSVLTQEGTISDLPKLSPVVFGKRATVSALTIRHELAVMDVKAAFYSALQKSDTFSIAEFSTWPRLHEFKATRSGYGDDVLVKPDGFIRIHEREKDGGVSEHTFFLEVDRSTETQGTLVTRAGCYLDYYKSGGFAVRNGAARSAFKEYPFRVLFVMKTAARLKNTALRLLGSNPPIRTLVYLSTFREAAHGPTGAVWLRPLDYGNAAERVASLRFPPSIGKHCKQKVPTANLAMNIPKLSLFSDA